MRTILTKFGWQFECWAVQRIGNLVDLVKSFPTSIYLQNLASIPPRTSLSKSEWKFNPVYIRLLTRCRGGRRRARPRAAPRRRSTGWSTSWGGTSKEWSEYWIEFSPQTSRGSFSAVSTPIFASKYALESSRRDLHNALLCTVLQSQFFRQKSPKLFRDWINEYSLIQSQTIRILHFFLRIFDEFFSGFRAKFQKIVTCVAFSIKFAKTN